MFQLERQQKLFEYITQHDKAGIDELSEVFGVSKVTIRRDLNDLEARRLILKTHGGAVSGRNLLIHEIPYEQKADINIQSKTLIGAAAASMVNDHDIIILDAGSTTYQITCCITQNDITLLTNDLRIAMEASKNRNIQLFVSGGKLSNSVYTLIGEQSTSFFKSFHVNKTFLGCDAFDLNSGIYNRTIEEVSIKREMINAAKEVIMVTDHSKMNKQAFCYLCGIEKISRLIIDKIDDHSRHKLENLGISVTVTQS